MSKDRAQTGMELAREWPTLIPSHPAAGVRVLVVDDYPDNARSLALLLSLYGHEIAVASDGPAALQMADTWLPNVVILDISLPGMNGNEVARRLRRKFRDQMVLIALTARGSEEDRLRSKEAGFDYFFAKPADPRQIQEILVHCAESAAGKNR